MNLVVWLLLILPTAALTLQRNCASTIKGCCWIIGHVSANRWYLVFLSSHGIDLGLPVLRIFGWVLQVLLLPDTLHRKHQKNWKMPNKINPMDWQRPTSGGKTCWQIFFHRSFGSLACREVMSTSVVRGDPNVRRETWQTWVATLECC